MGREIRGRGAHSIVGSEQGRLLVVGEVDQSIGVLLVGLERDKVDEGLEALVVEFQGLALGLGVEQGRGELRPKVLDWGAKGGTGGGDVVACEHGHVHADGAIVFACEEEEAANAEEEGDDEQARDGRVRGSEEHCGGGGRGRGRVGVFVLGLSMGGGEGRGASGEMGQQGRRAGSR